MSFVRATDVSVTVSRVAAIAFAVGGLVLGAYQLVFLAPFLWVLGSREKLMARMAARAPRGFAMRRTADGRFVIEDRY
jgi:hypothetical protein